MTLRQILQLATFDYKFWFANLVLFVPLPARTYNHAPSKMDGRTVIASTGKYQPGWFAYSGEGGVTETE